MGNKKGAIELSMTTIVIIVISIVVLIFGIIFARNIMCVGIQFTEEINKGVMDELKKIYGTEQYGVHCVGEGQLQPQKVASGGPRKITCMIKSDESNEYDITVNDIQVLSGSSNVNNWVLDKGWKGSVSAGGDGTFVTVLYLNIPKDASKANLKVILDVIKNKDITTKDTHSLYINIEPAGFIRSNIC